VQKFLTLVLNLPDEAAASPKWKEALALPDTMTLGQRDTIVVAALLTTMVEDAER
jgi:hypothetical protein